jgi:hypothetical protein
VVIFIVVVVMVVVIVMVAVVVTDFVSVAVLIVERALLRWCRELW